MELSFALDLAASRYPEADAIITPDERLCYGEWNRRVHGLAWKLSFLGIGPGDYAAICTGNGEAPLTMFFALHRIGAVAVMLSARWKSKNISFALQETGAKIILFDKTSEEEVLKAAGELEKTIILVCVSQTGEAKSPIYSFSQLIEGYSRPFPVLSHHPDDSGTILYTSGTTGQPKGVCRSSAADFAGALGIILEHGWERFERVLAVMPVYHTMGLHTAISMVLLNGAMVIPQNSEPETCFHCIHTENITAFYLVPTLYHDLTQYAWEMGGTQKVGKLAYAGAPMSAGLVKECIRCFSPALFVNQYGCTEMLCITVNRNLQENPLAAGRPGLYSRIRIVRASRQRRVLPHEILEPHEVGEIVINADSPQAFTHYFRQRELTRAVVRKGWYFTGDLGRVDEYGDLYVLGRIDDMIISGGENIYPTEVEAVLLEHPEVSDAAVIGEPDARWGETVTAFIVPVRIGLTSEEMDQFCLHHLELARFKRPRRFIFVEQIPKTASGKILRNELRTALMSNKKERDE